MFVLVKETDILFPRSKGRNFEVKEGPDSSWKPKTKEAKVE